MRAARRRFPVLRSAVALIGLGLLLAGAWMWIPRGDDKEISAPATDGSTRPTVVVDAGHGGHDNGAIRNGLREKDLTLDTALRIEKQLRKRGFPVVLTRRADVFIELSDRAGIANRIPRALFVSIHFNDNATAAGEGVETFYPGEKTIPGGAGWSLAGLFRQKPEPPPADNGLGFAQSVHGAIIGALAVTDRGVKQARYVVIRQTRCPAVLVEGGFINNPAQAREISKPGYRDRLAASIAEGVSDYHRLQSTGVRQAKLAQVR